MGTKVGRQRSETIGHGGIRYQMPRPTTDWNVTVGEGEGRGGDRLKYIVKYSATQRSRLWRYHPVAPRPLKYGPFVHRL
jgi:hypothetical protein